MSENRTEEQSKTSKLWLKIDQLHFKFLKAEETPAKLEIRKKLEGLVAEYLSLVPQERKFVSASTGDLIANSAKWKPDFSLVKAANAFRAVEQHAANLINQPWRQEFWSIRQNSGFYKHSVETALSGPEKLFLEMGYSGSTAKAQVLSLPRVGDHPVNTDLVISVARDCVLACVECQLLADIHSGVVTQFPITLAEVVDFRRDHIGSVDVCVRELLYRKNQLLGRIMVYHAYAEGQGGLDVARSVERMALGAEALSSSQLDAVIDDFEAVELAFKAGSKTREDQMRAEIAGLENQIEKQTQLLSEHKLKSAVGLTEIKQKKEDLKRLRGVEPSPQTGSQSSLVPECPACLERMLPPRQIYTCANGHVICSDCKTRMNETGNNECISRCGARYAGRATTVEQMVREIMGTL